MRRTLVALGLLLASCTAALAGSSAAPQPPYLIGGQPSTDPKYSAQNMTLLLATNANWLGARVVSRVKSEGEGSAYVWAQTCSAGAQTVHFSRRITVPGGILQPYVDAELGPRDSLSWLGRSGPPLLTKLQVLVNGRDALSAEAKAALAKYGFISHYAAPGLSLLRPGENRVEIVATKRATPKSLGSCDRRSAHPLGLEVVLTGTFAADVALVEPEPAREQFQPYKTTGEFNLTVSNKGPARALRGTFRVQFSSAATEVLYPGLGTELPKPFTSCTTTPPGFDISCAFVDFPPATTVTLSFLVRLAETGSPPPSSDRRFPIHWTVFPDGIADPATGNNARTVLLWLCVPGSTRPGCK